MFCASAMQANHAAETAVLVIPMRNILLIGENVELAERAHIPYIMAFVTIPKTNLIGRTSTNTVPSSHTLSYIFFFWLPYINCKFSKSITLYWCDGHDGVLGLRTMC